MKAMVIHTRSILILSYVLSLTILMIGLHPEPLSAKNFRVNTTTDINDLEPGNELCIAFVSISINPPRIRTFCTLRAAIEEANATPGEDTIYLESGVYKLSLTGTGEDLALTGDLDITDSVEIIGRGTDQTFIDADGIDRVFDIFGSSNQIAFSELSVVNGQLPIDLSLADNGGGGIKNRGTLSLDRVTIANNSVMGTTDDDVGGGLLNSGTCTVSQSIFHDNRSQEGGGLYNAGTGSLVMQTSTVHSNFSQGGGGLSNYGIASLINTTLSNNQVHSNSPQPGGALNNLNDLELIHCTIAENTAAAGGGISNRGSLTMVNTLVADNLNGNCQLVIDILSNGYNLDSDGTCGLTASPTDLSNIDPKLEPLRKSARATPTHALAIRSPAIDAGTLLSDVKTDQRAVSRPKGNGVDIGAYERIPYSIAPLITPLLTD